MPSIELTRAEWLDVRKRMLLRALKLTDPYDDEHSRMAKAQELRDAAVEKALAPETKPWDPARHRTLGDYLCDLVWSIHGNRQQSYQVKHASESLGEEGGGDEAPAPSSKDPEKDLVRAIDQAKRDRRDARIMKAVASDALAVFLFENRSAVDDGVDENGDARPNAEAASTRLALAKGYSANDIRQARKRLKYHMESVALEDDEENEP